MKLNGIAALRALLADMEADFGLHELPEPQRDILYAASLLASEKRAVTTSELHQHSLVKGMTRSTFFRSLKALSESGYLVASSTRSGFYEVGGGPERSNV
jgi:hypothetical protein